MRCRSPELAVTVRRMKTKSHKLKWATALCSVALFSFISANVAQAGLMGDPNGGDVKEPQTDEPAPQPRVWWIDPISPDGGSGGELESGSYSGTVVD